MRFVPVILIAVCTVVAGCAGFTGSPPQSSDGTMFRGDLRHTGVYDAAPIRAVDGMLWRFDTDGTIRSAPAVAGERLFFGSGDGRLYAIGKSSGAERWRFESGSPISSSPAVAEGTVYFSSRDDVVFALDARTGKERWRTETGPALPYEWGFDYYTSSPAVFNGTVVVGSGDGHVYALDAGSGDVRWRYRAAGPVRSSPAVADGVAYVGDVEGYLYALDIADGALLWTFETEGVTLKSANFGFDRKAIISSPSLTDSLVVVGGRDGFLYAVDRETGGERWRMNHEVSWAISSPAVAQGRVFSGTSDGRFVQAVDLATGRERWRVPTNGAVWSSPAYVRGVVYVGVTDGHVLALGAETGEELWRFPTGDRIWATPVPEDRVVYIGSDDGSLYALSGSTSVRAAPRRAVYWQQFDTGYEWFWPGAREMVRDYFDAAGYDVVDGAGLAAFMKADSAARSVVVFASSRVPKSVVADTSSSALLRDYLERGGRVVWLGPGPLTYTHDAAGAFAGLDFSVAERVLGVRFGGPDTRGHGGYYGTAPTAEGLLWGLRRGWSGCCAVDPASVTTVLASDERGNAAAWVKRIGAGEVVQLYVGRDGGEGLAFVRQGVERVVYGR